MSLRVSYKCSQKIIVNLEFKGNQEQRETILCEQSSRDRSEEFTIVFFKIQLRLNVLISVHLFPSISEPSQANQVFCGSWKE
jgi:hypothetical protein